MMTKLLNSYFAKIAFFAAMILCSSQAMAQVTYTDSVCAGSQDVVYGISNANASSTYDWWLSDPAAGTIDTSISSNDSVIEIDWGLTTGTYTLYSQETTATGCLGDTVQLNIVINPLPTVALVGDSICEGFSADITFTFTGTAPWVFEYTDGTTNYTDTANVSPYVVNTATYNSSQTITVTSLTDANSCAADTSGLPTAPIHVYPTPTSGPIYHY